MRVLVTGGRRYVDVPHIWSTLDQLDRERGRQIHVVIEGASDDVTGPYVGADYWAHQWALAHDRLWVRCHALWKEEGRAAGPLRNERMLKNHYPDIVLAFPGGNGTKNMTELAERAGVEVVRAHR